MTNMRRPVVANGANSSRLVGASLPGRAEVGAALMGVGGSVLRQFSRNGTSGRAGSWRKCRRQGIVLTSPPLAHCSSERKSRVGRNWPDQRSRVVEIGWGHVVPGGAEELGRHLALAAGHIRERREERGAYIRNGGLAPERHHLAQLPSSGRTHGGAPALFGFVPVNFRHHYRATAAQQSRPFAARAQAELD